MTFINYVSYTFYFCVKNSKMEKKERTVVHLQIGDMHEYFGSIANIYEFHTAEELGITYGSLRNYRLSGDNVYKNKKCIIRKGILLSKRGNRCKK